MPPQLTDFGHSMRQHFLFDENFTNLNHGSYGTYPKQVAEFREELTYKIERAPDRFLRYDYIPLLNKSRQCLADFLQVPQDECVLVPNTTLALDTILRNLTYTDQDVIIYFDTTYGAVEKALLYIQELWPQLTLRKIGVGCQHKFQLPMSHEEICESFTETVTQVLEEGLVVKAALFDTITSIPAARLPFERLTRMCKEYHILSIVDGAHGIGQIPLNLAELDADFFVSNCHKWLYTPRGCAVFHVPKRNQHLIRTTLPTSFGYLPTNTDQGRVLPMSDSSTFVNNFQFVATMDNTPSYCIPIALHFRQTCGGEAAIQKYIVDIVQRGADLVAQELGTFVLGHSIHDIQDVDGGQIDTDAKAHAGLRDCAMANVLLPLSINGSHLRVGKAVSHTNIGVNDVQRVVDWMQRILPMEYNTSLSIFCYQKQIWTRLSGQIYLELSDYRWIAVILKELCKRVEDGDYRK